MCKFEPRKSSDFSQTSAYVRVCLSASYKTSINIDAKASSSTLLWETPRCGSLPITFITLVVSCLAVKGAVI